MVGIQWKTKLIFLLCICTLVGMFSGCASQTEVNPSETVQKTASDNAQEEKPEAEDGFIACNSSCSKEDYISRLKELETEDNTLVIYTADSYSNEGILKLNQLLSENGYSWKLQIRQLPDEYWYGFTTELISDLEKQGIPADILTLCQDQAISAAREGQLAELEPYLNTESGQKLKAQLPEKYWELSAIDERYYGIASLAAPESGGWAVNQELMEKYNFTEKDLAKPLDELEEVLQTVSEGEKSNSQFTAFVVVPEFLFYRLPFSFADMSLPVGYWKTGGYGESSTEVDNTEELVNLFDTEEMRKLTETLNDYFQKGYVQQCAAGLPESDHFFMQPDYNGYPIYREDGLDTWTNRNGILLRRIPYFNSDTSSLSVNSNVILKSSSHQDEAFEFLSLMMTDQKVSDLLLYGAEGTDYEKEGDRIIAGENLTEWECSYKKLGNPAVSSPVSPYEDEKKTECLKLALDTVTDSPLYGFQFDETPVQNQVDAVRKQFSEMGYFRQMFLFKKSTESQTESQAENWEEYYDSYCRKLKEAGIDEVVDEMNRQLKAFLEK